jgi:hypothetical protein
MGCVWSLVLPHLKPRAIASLHIDFIEFFAAAVDLLFSACLKIRKGPKLGCF